ncbi:alpha/beta hydrolase family protein [Anoxybacillus sp. B7M1]|jgi:pimeloyl-ACP methyl ester carboxylesterase|uniref:alpha/beta fold hydrolase n=1 Tax=unclassified Anoxybacillus TaxID=2639704 RepID=UPI0005CD8010|nr:MULTISPECIES: alpha/beta hydrolase [unclassified Anoxybacillus]ANB57410.1 alpha/beta hydrolase family protein [Anoxybacillus sp. B2M1]ANB62947.1 alpha/beta hydrolase family protein [Anoxybacillus sp. B7M1]
MPYMTIDNDIRLYYTDAGEGKALVFIHPPGMGSNVFAKQQALTANFRVVTYDMRGNGKSSASNKPITISLLTEDLHQLLRSLQIERAIICSYSSGGSVAQAFALRYPEQTEAIVLIGGFPEVRTLWLYFEFLLGICTAKIGAISLLAKVLGTAHGKSQDEKKAIERYARLANQKDLFGMYKTMLHDRNTEHLEKLTVPLLIIYGNRDYYLHAYETIFKAYVPHARAIYIDKARHQIPTRHADELNAILTSYFLP